jgi:hypothetical protein
MSRYSAAHFRKRSAKTTKEFSVKAGNAIFLKQAVISNFSHCNSKTILLITVFSGLLSAVGSALQT